MFRVSISRRFDLQQLFTSALLQQGTPEGSLAYAQEQMSALQDLHQRQAGQVLHLPENRLSHVPSLRLARKHPAE